MGNRSRERFIASSGGLPIIHYGPIASAPAASEDNKGLAYYDPFNGTYISMGDTWLLASDLALLDPGEYDRAFVSNDELMLDINGNAMLEEV